MHGSVSVPCPICRLPCVHSVAKVFHSLIVTVEAGLPGCSGPWRAEACKRFPCGGVAAEPLVPDEAAWRCAAVALPPLVPEEAVMISAERMVAPQPAPAGGELAESAPRVRDVGAAFPLPPLEEVTTSAAGKVAR